jgi:cytochrome c oxidase assembly factor CtaG
MLAGWLIALVLAFATSPLYAPYAALPQRPWGLSELADQQLAAGVMWVPGSIAYTVAIIVFVYRWLEPESSARRLGLAGGG